MTIRERIFWRVFVADALLAVLWLLLGGSFLEAIIIAVLQAVLLLIVEAVIGAVHKMTEIFKNKGRRLRHRVQAGGRESGPKSKRTGGQVQDTRIDIRNRNFDQADTGRAWPVGR